MVDMENRRFYLLFLRLIWDWLQQKMLFFVLMHFIVDLARAAWLWEQIFYFTPVTVEADILSSSIVFLTLYIYIYNFILFAATFFNLRQLYFICSNFLICSISFVGHRVKLNVLQKKSSMSEPPFLAICTGRQISFVANKLKTMAD